MKIEVVQTGGFAGIYKKQQVDTEQLQPLDAANVQRLVQDADFFNLPPYVGAPLGCDMFEYDIAVEDQGRKKSVHVWGVGIPEKLQPLVDWCKNGLNTKPPMQTITQAPPEGQNPPEQNPIMDALTEFFKLFGGK